MISLKKIIFKKIKNAIEERAKVTADNIKLVLDFNEKTTMFIVNEKITISEEWSKTPLPELLETKAKLLLPQGAKIEIIVFYVSFVTGNEETTIAYLNAQGDKEKLRTQINF